MKVAFKKSFLKSIERLRDKRLKTSILKAISQVEAATEVQKISSIKKLTGFVEHPEKGMKKRRDYVIEKD